MSKISPQLNHSPQNYAKIKELAITSKKIVSSSHFAPIYKQVDKSRKWYKYLKNKETEVKRECLLSYEKIEPPALTVFLSTDVYTYSKFRNFYEFYNFIVKCKELEKEKIIYKDDVKLQKIINSSSSKELASQPSDSQPHQESTAISILLPKTETKIPIPEIKPTSSICFFEVIFGNFPQKIYFDLDIENNGMGIDSTNRVSLLSSGIPLLESTTEGGTTSNTLHKYSLSKEDAEKALNCLLDCIKTTLPVIKDSDLLVFSSHSKTKSSYHVVVDRWYLPDHNTNRFFFESVMSKYPTIYHKAVDQTMYKSTQNFRLFGSNKWKSPRTKILDVKLSRWKDTTNTNVMYEMDILDFNVKYYELLGDVDADFEPEFKEYITNKKLTIFKASLIGCTEGCKLLPFYKEKVQKEYSVEYNEVFLDNNIDRILDMCAKSIEDDMEYTDVEFPFQFDKIENGIICLRRVHASYCSICDRIHDNIDPFIVNHKNSYYLHCRRATGKIKSIYIGSIYNPDSDYSKEFKEMTRMTDLHAIPDKKEPQYNHPNITDYSNKSGIVAVDNSHVNSSDEIKVLDEDKPESVTKDTPESVTKDTPDSVIKDIPTLSHSKDKSKSPISKIKECEILKPIESTLNHTLNSTINSEPKIIPITTIKYESKKLFSRFSKDKLTDKIKSSKTSENKSTLDDNQYIKLEKQRISKLTPEEKASEKRKKIEDEKEELAKIRQDRIKSVLSTVIKK